MARARASAAVSEPEFDEAWRDDLVPVSAPPAPRLVPEIDSRDTYEPPRGAGVPGRRTVTIRGQVAARPAARRPRRDPYARGGSRPDRIAMWAVLLGLLLVLVAATTSHAATLHAAHIHAAHIHLAHMHSAVRQFVRARA
jgi:hypothetical protein